MSPAMRTLGRALGGAALALALAAPAGAGTIYAWRTDDGGYAFADELKRVPERYRDRVEVRETGSLRDHARFTPTDPAATQQYASELEQRLAALRERNEALRRIVEAPVTTPGGADDTDVQVRFSDDGDPSIEVRARGHASGDPVIIEDFDALPRRGVSTRQNTIVRRGDEIIAIVRERNPNRSSSYPRESDVDEGDFDY